MSQTKKVSILLFVSSQWRETSVKSINHWKSANATPGLPWKTGTAKLGMRLEREKSVRGVLINELVVECAISQDPPDPRLLTSLFFISSLFPLPRFQLGKSGCTWMDIASELTTS